MASKLTLNMFDAILKEHYKPSTWIHDSIVYKDVYKEEKPMSETTTFTCTELGAAKKQRDAFRNRLRADLIKYAEKYNVTKFEAIHAIVDTVMLEIDNEAKNYGKPGLPNALCQTVLPQTQEIIDTFAKNYGTKHASDLNTDSAVAAYDKMTFGSTPLWSPVLKAKPSNQGMPEKLDKYVTDADISAEIVWYGQLASQAKKAFEPYKDLDDGCYYLQGYSEWLYSSNTLLPGQAGRFHVIVKLRKKSPYLSALFISKLNLSVPKGGFKFRKLKNKQIYKLQQYSKFDTLKPKKKSVNVGDIYGIIDDTYPASLGISTTMKSGSTVNLLVSKEGHKEHYTGQFVKQVNLPKGYLWVKNPATDTAYILKASYGLQLPLEEAYHATPPQDYHWEVCLANKKNAILMMNYYGYSADGTPKISSPGAEFPPVPTHETFSIVIKKPSGYQTTVTITKDLATGKAKSGKFMKYTAQSYSVLPEGYKWDINPVTGESYIVSVPTVTVDDWIKDNF